jgi:hypothetical protein
MGVKKKSDKKAQGVLGKEFDFFKRSQIKWRA